MRKKMMMKKGSDSQGGDDCAHCLTTGPTKLS
jgi:hypothetical protein